MLAVDAIRIERLASIRKRVQVRHAHGWQARFQRLELLGPNASCGEDLDELVVACRRVHRDGRGRIAGLSRRWAPRSWPQL